MPVYATAGSKLYIGDPITLDTAPLTAGDFSGAFVQIANCENLGAVGDSSESIDFDSIDAGRRFKARGIRDAGSMEVVCGIDYADPGQIALLAAEKTPHNYQFRLVFNDAPPGGTPSTREFAAIVGSVSEALDGANSVMKLSASLWVNSNVVRTNASA